MIEPKLVLVYRAAGELEAQAIRAKLQSEGIPVLVQSEAASAFPFTVDGLGEFRILVPSAWENEARAALERSPEPPVEP